MNAICALPHKRTHKAGMQGYHPQAKNDEAIHEYGVTLTPWAELPRADAIVAAVAHRE